MVRDDTYNINSNTISKVCNVNIKAVSKYGLGWGFGYG